jgi:endonuclease/exonuclease/phosphatase family metal-dependent hydrolase
MLLVSCGPVRNFDEPYEPFYEGNYAVSGHISGEKIKIVTWNLSFAENLDTAIETLTQVEELKGADILLMQEMDEIGVDLLAKEMGYNYVYYPATVHPRNNKNFGNAVLSKWEISEHEKILLPKSGSNRKQTRNAVKAVIKIDDQEISAYSVHLETFWIFQRRNQRQAAYINQLFERDEYSIVGGDFNSLTRGSIFYLEQEFAQSSLVRLSGGTGYTFKYLGLKLTLDHLFASSVNVFESGVWRWTAASDHYPIWSDISIK